MPNPRESTLRLTSTERRALQHFATSKHPLHHVHARTRNALESKGLIALLDTGPGWGLTDAGRKELEVPDIFDDPIASGPASSDNAVRGVAKMLKTDEWLAGFAVALAEVHRIEKNSSAIVEVAKAAGLTIAGAKRAGADSYDTAELRRAGVR